MPFLDSVVPLYSVNEDWYVIEIKQAAYLTFHTEAVKKIKTLSLFCFG